ncbi:MAG: carbohydrate kinase [Verrucomicrobia bacterium]|nr:carbohydrate kinase [Verrucomicrobiota bacterium]
MNFKVVGIGEVLWDLLPGGRQLGGAPANFAYHAGALGAEARVISRVGDDELGRELMKQLKKLRLRADCVERDPLLPTGTVSVEVDAAGQPHFTIHEGAAWDNLQGEPAGRIAVSQADAICFGTLAQRSEPSRSTIRRLVATTSPRALRIFDVNLRQHFCPPPIIEDSLALADVLKVNESELPRLAEMFGLTDGERAQITQLIERFELRCVAYTRGGRGSLLFADGRWSDHPGVRVNVVDTVGAGDSFTAAMTLGFLAGWTLDEINQRANEVAAYVASCAGGTPALPDTLRALFQTNRPAVQAQEPRALKTK